MRLLSERIVIYPIALSIEIAASPARVWRALCLPAEVVLWDEAIETAIDVPADYPSPGQHARWRCRAGVFRLLHDRPVEVVAERRLRSFLALGPYRYDETYMLEAARPGCRLTAAVSVWAVIPVLHSFIELLYLGPATRRAFSESLVSIKRLCEAEPV